MEVIMTSYKNKVLFKWSEPETGYFGNIFLSSYNGLDNLIDAEYMTKEFVKKVICQWIDNAKLR